MCDLGSGHQVLSVAGKRVAVEYQKYDKYRRFVGKAWVNRLDACLEQVRAGFAWHYKKYQHEQSTNDQRLYANAEIRAREERLGVVARE